MKKNRLLIALLCLSLLAALLTGCGGSSQEMSDYAFEETSAMESPAEMEAAGITSDTGIGGYSDPNAKLIRTVHMDAQTREYDTLMQALEEKIASLGGYVENRDAYNGSEYYSYSNRYCNMVIRIPAQRLEEFVTHVNENFNVTNTSETVENITLQYADTAARVEALETEQDRLLELLENAENLTEILEIESRLSDVRYELTSYASRLRVMDNQVTYATVHLNVDEVEKLTPVQEPTVWERISTAFSNSVEDITEGAVDIFVWFVGNSPRLVIWAVVIGVGFVIGKAIGRKRKKKQAPPPQNMGNEQ